MEPHTQTAIKSLEFIIKSLPADWMPSKPLRDSLCESVDHLKVLLETLKAEEKEAFSKTTEKFVQPEDVPPELCPCKSKECTEAYELELSLVKKKQFLKEALLARSQLAESLSELDSQVAILQPLIAKEEAAENVVVN